MMAWAEYEHNKSKLDHIPTFDEKKTTMHFRIWSLWMAQNRQIMLPSTKIIELFMHHDDIGER